MRSIATYAADGSRLRNFPLSSIEYLLAKDEMHVRRNGRGEITKAFFHPTPTTSGLLNTAHMGQSYSYDQLLASGHHAWKHREFVGQQDMKDAVDDGVDPAELEAFIRNTFRSVALSVITPEPSGKVVSIDSFRQKRAEAKRGNARKSFRGAKVRPIEFDSQKRAA